MCSIFLERMNAFVKWKNGYFWIYDYLLAFASSLKIWYDQCWIWWFSLWFPGKGMGVTFISFTDL